MPNAQVLAIRQSPVYTAVVRRIRAAIRARYDYQADFARGIGWSEMKVSRILSQDTGLKLDDLLEICRHLGVSADYLLGVLPAETFETFASRTSEPDMMALPVISLRDGDDSIELLRTDAGVLSVRIYFRVPRFSVEEAYREHCGHEIEGDVDLARFVIVRLPPGVYESVPVSLYVDRRAVLDVIQGVTVLAQATGTDLGYRVGKLYAIGDTLTLVGGALPPLVITRQAVLGVVIAAHHPVPLVD